MNNKILGLLAVLAVILVALIYLQQGSLTTQTVNVSEIKETGDLDKADQTIDEEELDSIDGELEMLDKDSEGL